MVELVIAVQLVSMCISAKSEAAHCHFQDVTDLSNSGKLPKSKVWFSNFLKQSEHPDTLYRFLSII